MALGQNPGTPSVPSVTMVFPVCVAYSPPSWMVKYWPIAIFTYDLRRCNQQTLAVIGWTVAPRQIHPFFPASEAKFTESRCKEPQGCRQQGPTIPAHMNQCEHHELLEDIYSMPRPSLSPVPATNSPTKQDGLLYESVPSHVYGWLFASQLLDEFGIYGLRPALQGTSGP